MKKSNWKMMKNSWRLKNTITKIKNKCKECKIKSRDSPGTQSKKNKDRKHVGKKNAREPEQLKEPINICQRKVPVIEKRGKS